ncbi:protein-ADP-ribose hydrolase [Bifidobacterium ruminantium]|uniref:protein-ADP-ribose hydrolase n=1 Tax=Bifidobacterium ruminantium TaxID=78346 RepID=UPI00249311CF|nr:protein-ADP-ribose hydrolase [Bifidobacterium ruminantium]
MDQRQRRIWLIGQLLREYPEYRDAGEADLPIPHDHDEQRQLLRALQNVRPPAPVSERFLHVQDEYLGGMLAQRAITDADDVPPAETLRSGTTLAIWQGDITALRCDAIVNAANSGLTGCYAPNHHCIDNAIHTAAGVQLRLACERIMERQGHPEPVGQAKITPGFNLPARYVLHTVGPMIPTGDPTPDEQEQLADCYRSCLRLAAEHGLETVAFCSISTGEFHFPAELAARIAVRTVHEFLSRQSAQQQSAQRQPVQPRSLATAAPTAGTGTRNTGIRNTGIRNTGTADTNTYDTGIHPANTIRKVIFDVFSDRDRQIYERVFADHD